MFRAIISPILMSTSFDDDEQVENFVLNWLQTRPTSFYEARVKKKAQSAGKNA